MAIVIYLAVLAILGLLIYGLVTGGPDRLSAALSELAH